jgi:hypothetical protein
MNVSDLGTHPGLLTIICRKHTSVHTITINQLQNDAGISIVGISCLAVADPKNYNPFFKYFSTLGAQLTLMGEMSKYVMTDHSYPQWDKTC